MSLRQGGSAFFGGSLVRRSRTSDPPKFRLQDAVSGEIAHPKRFPSALVSEYVSLVY